MGQGIETHFGDGWLTLPVLAKHQNQNKMETKLTFALVYTNRATRKITFLGAFPTREQAQAQMQREIDEYAHDSYWRIEHKHTNSARVFDRYDGKEYWHGTFEILKH